MGTPWLKESTDLKLPAMSPARRMSRARVMRVALHFLRLLWYLLLIQLAIDCSLSLKVLSVFLIACIYIQTAQIKL